MNPKGPSQVGGSGRKSQRRAARRAARLRQRNRRIALTVLAAAAAIILIVVLVLVGGDSPPEPSASVRIEASDFAYSPDPVLALAGEVEVTLENTGATGHELIVLREGTRITSPAEYDESMAIETIPSIARDTTVTRTMTLDPGTYQMVCLLSGHFEAGMEADMVVSVPEVP